MCNLETNWDISTSQALRIIGSVPFYQFHGLWKFKAFSKSPTISKWEGEEEDTYAITATSCCPRCETQPHLQFVQNTIMHRHPHTPIQTHNSTKHLRGWREGWRTREEFLFQPGSHFKLHPQILPMYSVYSNSMYPNKQTCKFKTVKKKHQIMTEIRKAIV